MLIKSGFDLERVQQLLQMALPWFCQPVHLCLLGVGERRWRVRYDEPGLTIETGAADVAAGRRPSTGCGQRVGLESQPALLLVERQEMEVGWAPISALVVAVVVV